MTIIEDEARFISRLSFREQTDMLGSNIDIFQSNKLRDNIVFSPEDIELADDAFQNSDSYHFAEWWYFDAILNEKYSITIIIYVFSFMDYKFVVTGLNIYKNGVTEVAKEKLYFMNEVYISDDIPLIIIEEKQVMKGYINVTTGEWVYDVSLEIGESSVDLQFIGSTKGWKGRLSIGGWAVILPKANVSGMVRVNGIETEVVGTGYHDHNWDITLWMRLNFGWYWGRINSGNLSVTWFVIMDTIFSDELVLVINKGNNCYINIDPKNINFIPEDFQIKDNRPIPQSFCLIAESENVSLRIDLTANGLHHGNRNFGLRRYWRYHVESQGSIKVDSQIEAIDGIEIAEFMCFR
jgi:hypothetical protein